MSRRAFPCDSLTRRDLLRLGAGAAVAPFINRGRYRVFAQSETRYAAATVELMQSSLVIDMLNQFRQVFRPEGFRWLRDPSSFTEVDYIRYRDSGINVLQTGGAPLAGMGETYLARWNGFIAAHHQWFVRVDDVRDLEYVKQSGKTGILIGTQVAHFETLQDITMLHGLGLRVSGLAYNYRNALGDGVFEKRDGGLSKFGAEAVERMNQVGMAIDVSHSSDLTTLDAIDVSRKPLLITHAACRALVPFVRNKTDEAIKKMAAKGGVMGLCLVSFVIRERPPVTVDHVIDHFDHIRKLVGIEHAGIGSDYDLDGADTLPDEERRKIRAKGDPNYPIVDKEQVDGLGHPKRYYDLTEALLRRGYTRLEIEGILGANCKRALGQIWSN